MPTNKVILGARYRHDQTEQVMRVYSVSVPDLDDYVKLIQPELYGFWHGFSHQWRGSWDQFRREWTLLEKERYE